MEESKRDSFITTSTSINKEIFNTALKVKKKNPIIQLDNWQIRFYKKSALQMINFSFLVALYYWTMLKICLISYNDTHFTTFQKISW